MDEYRSTLPEARVERLRRWHQEVSDELHRRGPIDMDYLGLDLHVPEHVFPPTRVSDLLGRCVRERVVPGSRVLDMGCGAGANALLAAQQGADVVAVDVNPAAVAATASNAVRSGVADRVDVAVSDLFAAVDGTFDVVVFDPPFRWFAPRDQLEMAITDENYRTLTQFFGEVAGHLADSGEVLLFFGTSGDVPYLDEIIGRSGLDGHTVAERTLDVRGEQTTYFVRRLVNPAPGEPGA